MPQEKVNHFSDAKADFQDGNINIQVNDANPTEKWDELKQALEQDIGQALADQAYEYQAQEAKLRQRIQHLEEIAQ